MNAISLAIKENMEVYDSKDFHYTVDFEFWPHLGVAIAYYRGVFIDRTDLRRMYEPTTDCDRDWEIYEDDLAHWKDEAKTNLLPRCKMFLDALE